MKLNLEKIKSITQGAERITEENGVIRFFRFRAEERDVYPPTEHFEGITGATAGIQMEYRTDAYRLSMRVITSKATNRSFFCHDVFVDGRLIGCIRNFTDDIADTSYSHIPFPLGRYSGSFDLGQGMKTVRIVFPWSVVSGLEEMCLEGASCVEPVKPSKTMLMYGDSITQGYDSLNPSQCYSLRLARALDAQAFIKAIGGQMFRPALSALKAAFAPDYITVAYGTNDWNRAESVAVFESNCNAFLNNLSENYPDTRIFVLSPIYRADHRQTEGVICPFPQIEQTIRDAAQNLGNVTFLSGWELVPQDELLFADRKIHPADRGFDHYFNNLKEKIIKLL